MFTDGPATPVRIEVLLNVLKQNIGGLNRGLICSLLQPEPLLERGPEITKANIHAVLQLNLAEEKKDVIILSAEYEKKKSFKENILIAADSKILFNWKIEYHLALFYAYYLGLNEKVYERTKFKGEEWADHFNKDVFDSKRQENKFNEVKFNGLHRWMRYLGLGWYDSNDNFQANPYERLLRSLPDIFRNKPRLKGDDFMVQLAEVCPELDGGDVFIKANTYKSYDVAEKQCTLGLSHALVDLHEDKIIRLGCPVDSHGWNIGLAQPPRDETLNSNRIEIIEFLGN